MDPTVKQMLDGFAFSIKNYISSLGPDNPKIMEAQVLLDDLKKKASAGADVSAISTDKGFSRLGQLAGELASEKPLSQEKLVRYGDQIQNHVIPEASIPAAGYHMAWQQLNESAKQKMKKYYDRIFAIEQRAENAIFFNTMLMEDGVLLNMSREPLIATAQKALEDAKEAFSPTVDYQQKLTVETYTKVNTIQELEFEGTKLAELSNVEHDWDALFLEVIGLLPACAQVIEAFGPDKESVAKLRNSYKFMSEVFGITWEDVFKNQRYLYFWENIFWSKLPAAKKAKYAVTSAKEYADVLKHKFFDPFIKDEPVPKKNPATKVVFWEKEFDVQEVMKLLRNPPRPLIVPE